MKLRNKKTGEIVDYKDFEYDLLSTYKSIAELNEEWEDYEEPKIAWFINSQGDAHEWPNAEGDEWTKEKAIGNYFETKEEAEKAVEKLKAWKRLKDAGLKFGRWDGYVNAGNSIESGDHFACCGFVNAYGQIYNSQDNYEQYRKDLDLLFGGEE